MHQYTVRTKVGWLGVRIMCLSGAICISADCCFSELVDIKSAQQVGLTKSRHRHHQKVTNSLHDVVDKLFTWH